MHLFINSLAATAGGGLTYIRNVIPLLARSDVRITVALPTGLSKEFHDVSGIGFLEIDIPPAHRFWFEQSSLPGIIRRHEADVLLSTGNFALRNSPVPQILLSRNSIYTCNDFYRDLQARHEYRTWLDTRMRAMLAKKSVRWAEITVAPSEAFAAELRRWTGVSVQAIHHGFDRDSFTRDSGPLTRDIEGKIREAERSIKLLFVSHYNYYRNFETLLRALPLLRERCNGRPVKLFLTCKLKAGENPGSYNPRAAAELIQRLDISDMVVQLGSIPYSKLHQLYRRADVYVTPAYTETFAHPLVEAMSCGLPVVASSLAVHQEICGDAAVYFSKFSASELADRVAQVVQSLERSKRMAVAGLERARQFSWKLHVEAILKLSHAATRSKILRNTSCPGPGENVA